MKEKRGLGMTGKRMGLLIFAILALMLFAVIGSAFTVPHEEWSRIYGGTGFDVSYSIQQTSDGGYILAGYTQSFGVGNYDGWLIKTNSSGDEQWNNTFGGMNNDHVYSVQQTSDGGYILAGEYNWGILYGENASNIWLIKTDSFGNMQWNRIFGGASRDGANTVQETSDGGYIIAGFMNGIEFGGAGKFDAWLIKTDSFGNEMWNNTFGGLNEEFAYSVQETSDGGYIIAGDTQSFGNGYTNILLVKIDSFGNMQWRKTYGGVSHQFAYSVQETSDGGYIIAGKTVSYGSGNYDAWLIKTDSSGNEDWNKTFGGINYDAANSVQQTSDGGYILAGTNYYGNGYNDAWLIKTNLYGIEEWNQTFGGVGYDNANFVQQTSDGGYIFSGKSCSFGTGNCDAWLVKLSNCTQDPIPLEIQVGEGAPTQEMRDAFNASYDINGGISVLGNPITYVELNSSGYYVQEFPGASGIPGGVIMNGSNANEAYYLHGAIWEKYKALPDKTILGALSQDELPAGTSPKNTTGRYSAFENGRIHWISDANTNHPQKGQSFVTYGELDAKYTVLGGTNHWLGFPAEDQKVFEGHFRQRFEGGWIYWNETSLAYEEATKLIAIIPLEFSNKAHTGGESPQHFDDKANQLVEYYRQQSYQKEKIVYDLYLNSSGNDGWHRIPDNYEYLQSKFAADEKLSPPVGVICTDCILPPEVAADRYVFLSAMKEIGQGVRNITTINEVNFYSPEDYDIALIAYPFAASRSGDIDWPNANGRQGRGFVFVDNGPHSAWYHEIGHLYFGGYDKFVHIANWGIMSNNASATEINPPPPFTLFDKEFPCSREDMAGMACWINKTTPSVWYGKGIVRNINDDRLVEEGALKFGDDNKYYIFEGRYPTDSVPSLTGIEGNNPLNPVEGIEVYRFEMVGGSEYKVSARKGCYAVGCLFIDPNTVSLKPGEAMMINDATVRVRAIKDGDGTLSVDVANRELFNEFVWVIISNGLDRDTEIPSGLPSSEGNLDVDLQVIASDGRRVGMNYTTGEFINEIEGANWSGNYMGGGEEWISVPSNVPVTPYVVLSTDLKAMLANDSSMKVNITSTLTVYDTSGNSAESAPIVLTVNASNMDENLTLSIPANVTYLSPLENGGEYITNESIIPIRFTATNGTSNEFINDGTANVNVTDQNGMQIANFNLTSGLAVNLSENLYEAEFNTSNYPEFINGTKYNVLATLGNESGFAGYALSTFVIGSASRQINGYVIDSINKTGIAGVTVSTNASNSTLTDETGFYSLNVSVGTYELKAKFEPTHYVNNSVTVTATTEMITSQDIELVEKPKGRITGGVRIG